MLPGSAVLLALADGVASFEGLAAAELEAVADNEVVDNRRLQFFKAGVRGGPGWAV